MKYGVLAFLLCFSSLHASAEPAATPAPAPTHRPPGTFTWNASILTYFFWRTNGNSCLSGCNPKGIPNAQAVNSGIRLHGQYDILNSPWTLGATYFGAEPFNANAFGVLGVGYNPEVDNTLPGYALSTLAEMYVQYKTRGVFFQTGKEIINTPWANPADSRMVPVAFQGTQISGNVSPTFKIGAMYMARVKSRVTSAFDANTFLTSCNTAFPTGKGPIAGVSGTFGVPGDQCNTVQSTKGFWLLDASYAAHGVEVNAYQYHMFDLVNMTYVDAKYAYARESPANPFVAAQYWADNDSGRALLGTVHSHGFGLEYGQNVGRNVVLSASFDDQPIASYIVPASECPGTASSVTKPGPGNIFGGVQDTTKTGLPPGQVQCYAGGTASPYTDNYESEPLYTSAIGIGITDTRKAGFALKTAATIETNNRRLKAILSQSRYNVSLPGSSGGTSNKDIIRESDFDVQYFFNAVDATQPYRGFSIRERLVDRVQTFAPTDFKYVRTQLEFDF